MNADDIVNAVQELQNDRDDLRTVIAEGNPAKKLAALLDIDAMYDLVVGAIADSRDKAPRAPGDRDSADVLDDVIAALRAAS